MADYDFLSVSNGSGDAILMHVRTTRLKGAVNIDVDSVVNVPNKFIGTYGKLQADGFMDPTTKRDFKGHLNSNSIAIDFFEAGNADDGTPEGYIVIIKPNTGWSDRVAKFIQNTTGSGTPEKIYASSIVAPDKTIPRVAVEPNHIGRIYMQNGGGNGGQVIIQGNETKVALNAVDNTGYGITADGTNNYLKTARAGTYLATFFATASDSPSHPTNNVIVWFEVSKDNGVTFPYRIRHYDRSMDQGCGQTWTQNMKLAAGDCVRVIFYCGATIRLGAVGSPAGDSLVTDEFSLINLGPNLMLVEQR